MDKIENHSKRNSYEAYISVGSNLGDRIANCRNAIDIVSSGSMDVIVSDVSSFYETEPWGNTEQGFFVNAVFKVATTLSPAELLAFLKSIESRMERTTSGKWGPRVIDLDIIFYGNVTMSGEALTIPHPHAHERAFVLTPLSEIAPDYVHPVLGKSISELVNQIGSAGIRKIE